MPILPSLRRTRASEARQRPSGARLSRYPSRLKRSKTELHPELGREPGEEAGRAAEAALELECTRRCYVRREENPDASPGRYETRTRREPGVLGQLLLRCREHRDGHEGVELAHTCTQE